VSLIESALKAWKRGSVPPHELLTLNWLKSIAGSDEAKFTALQNAIYQYVAQNLAATRAQARLGSLDSASDTLDSLKISIARDFMVQYSKLEAWSALYYQYIEGSLTVGDLVKAALGNAEKTYEANEKHYRRRVLNGLKLVCNEVCRWEEEAQPTDRPKRFLGAKSDGFFDPNQTAETLIQRLGTSGEVGILSLEGLGGIGKTSLARRISEQMISQSIVTRVIWISVRHAKFNPFAMAPLEIDEYAAHSRADVINDLVKQLGHENLSRKPADDQVEGLIPILHASSLLVVIDNLESLDDSRLLIPDLRRMQGTTRFLLTSRESMARFEGVAIHSVGALPLSESRQLIQAELKRLGSNRVLTDSEAGQIYEVVGGIPLALKLIAAQFVVFPAIDEVLAEIRNAIPGKKQELMFDFIYRRTWQLLNLPARQLLLAIYDSVSIEGETFDWIERMAELDGLTNGMLHVALEELHFYALLEVNARYPPRYALHQLTITFLKTNIAQTHWINSPNGNES
jgi:hypothetical protein